MERTARSARISPIRPTRGHNFQPPFNKVSRERDPGRVNLNTVTGRRSVVANGIPQIWSEVFDGIMHRIHDGNPTAHNQLGHTGPAWRDVVLSRRGIHRWMLQGNCCRQSIAMHPIHLIRYRPPRLIRSSSA